VSAKTPRMPARGDASTVRKHVYRLQDLVLVAKGARGKSFEAKQSPRLGIPRSMYSDVSPNMSCPQVVLRAD
jgi:hypothetical protein